MSYLQKIVYLTEQQYGQLEAGTLSGHPEGVQEDVLYITTDPMNIMNLEGTLPVNKGGTGAVTFPAGSLLVGNGTNALTTITKTSDATGGTVVIRDSYGDFSAHAITTTASNWALNTTNNTAGLVIGIESQSYKFGLHMGTGGINHGLYDWHKNGTGSANWVLLADANNNWTFNGNAGTATAIKTAGTTAQFYRGDNSWSSTLTGSITISKAGECGIEVNNTQATNPNQVAFIVGSSGNGGIFSRKHSKWIVYSDASGNIVLNGNANTATSLTHKTLTTTTVDNTFGSYAFSIAATTGMSQITTNSTDYVGLQIGDNVDKWQLTATGNSLFFRQNDNGGTNTSWNNWVKIASNANVETGDNNGQVKIAGTNISVKGLQALAYKDSLEASDIPNLSWSKITSDKPAYTTRWPTWDEVTGKPSTFAPSAHEHNYIGKDGFIAYPSDGRFSTRSSHTGYIKIKIPYTKSATMFTFDVDIYNYYGDSSVRYHIGGYNYDNASWINTTAYCIAPLSNTKGNLTVRFWSNSDDEMYVSIGEPDTAWSIPSIIIHNITLNFNNDTLAKWKSGWTITIENTAFDANLIKATKTNTNIAYKANAANFSATTFGIAYYSDTVGTFAGTGAGTSGQYLKSNGSSAPTWATFSASTVGLGNVENTKLSTWTGSSNITTVGTISTGTWHGTKIANDYIANPKVTIAGNDVSLGGSLAASTLTESLGLSKALHFIGVTTTDMTGGTAANHSWTGTPAGISNYTPKQGDVVINSTKQDEWVCTSVSGTTYTWERLGSDTSYKIVQSAVTSPTASATTSTTFIDTISQDANGVITATKKTLPKYAASSSAGGAATNATTTANTSDSLYLVGVKSGATTTLLHDTSITVKGNTLEAGIFKLHQGTAADPSLTGNARIEFDYSGGQPVVISYTPNDGYRSPAGLKIMGGTSATPAWLEVEGNVYAAGFNGPLTGNVTGNVSGTAANVTGTVAIANGGTGATSAADARSNLGLGTIATKADTAYVKYAGNITGIGSGSPASGAQTWWKNTTNVPKLSVVAAYNNSGSEKTFIFSKGNADATYGSILMWGYGDRYLRILRKNNSNADTWVTTDWEKIDAGYADSAGSTQLLQYRTQVTTLEQVDTFGTTDSGYMKVAKVSKFTGQSGTWTNNDGILINIPWSNAYGHEIFVNDNGYDIHHRANNNGTWLDWVKILDTSTTYSENVSGNAISVTCGTDATLATINDVAIKINVTKPTYTYSDVGAAPSSTVSCTTANVKSALGTGSGTTKFLREDGSWQTPAYIANTDEKLKIAAVTSGTTYYPIVAANSTAAANRQYDATGFAYLGTNGTTSAVGVAKITLGNSTASGTANNKQGSIGLYGSTAYLTTIISGAPSAANTLTLPTTTGTIALTSDIPTVVTSVDDSASLPTSNAVKTFVEGKGYLTTHSNSYGKITVSAQSSAVTALAAQSSATTPSSKSANETLKFTTANKWIIATGTESSTAGADEIKIAHLVPSSISNSGPTSAQTPGYNSTFNIPVISLDEAGHVTGISTTTVKIPASDNTDHYPSAWCDTAAGTQAKTAYCTDYTLTENTWLHVLIKNANSYNGKITLNVNSKGAKDIWINGTVSSSTNKTLPAGTYLVYYDGSKYEFRTDGLLPGSISGNADSVTQIPTTDSFWNWRKVLVGVSNSDTDAAVAANTNGSVYQTNSVSIQPASGKLKATELIGNTITIDNSGDASGVAHLIFSRTDWNYITMPNNDNSVLAIGYGTGTNYSRLVIHKTGTVRPGRDNEQFLGSSNYRWKRVYGVDFYGNLTGTASGNLPLSGGRLTGTLTLKPTGSGDEGGQINIAPAEDSTTQSGVAIDQKNSELRIFGIASADGTTRTGTGTELHIDPYLHTLYGAYDVTFKTIKIDNSADNTGVPHLIFSRSGWNYITIPNNDSSVLSIGFGETGNNANQRLVIFKTGTVRPGANGSQDLGDSTHKWNNVYGLNFYGNTFSGTANTANQLGKQTITNSSLDEFVSDGSFKYSWAGGSNQIVSKPTGTDAFGVMTFKTADNWTGQIFVSTNQKPGIYWRLNLTTSSPSYGNWTRLANGNANIYYGTSETAASTAVKVVVCTDYHTLTAGDMLIIKFTNTNSATEPSLNVNNTGAKAIRASYSGGLALLSSSSQIRDTCMFIYDGTYWVQMSTDCVKQMVTDSSSAVWRAVLVSASNNSNESFTPDQLFAKTYAAHNVKYQASTGTFRAPIFKSTMFKLEYDHVDKAYATWNNTDSSIDFIFM